MRSLKLIWCPTPTLNHEAASGSPSQTKSRSAGKTRPNLSTRFESPLHEAAPAQVRPDRLQVQENGSTGQTAVRIFTAEDQSSILCR